MSQPTERDQAISSPARSGRQIGAEHVEKLRSYLDELRSNATRLPSRGGKVDKSAIALACGFDRQTLYNNAEAKALLEQAVEDLGVDCQSGQVPNSRAAHLEQLMDRRDRRIQRLEEMLETRTAEVTELRRTNKSLLERLRQYEVMEEFMTTSGRRYHP
jgi:hypothetical protein